MVVSPALGCGKGIAGVTALGVAELGAAGLSSSDSISSRSSVSSSEGLDVPCEYSCPWISRLSSSAGEPALRMMNSVMSIT